MSATQYTFKGNHNHGRHAWLRLTPAYSVQLVEELLDRVASDERVLDPFCGTGTTALVCATRGFACDTVDINPFLVWLARAKVATYDRGDISAVQKFARGLDSASSGGGEWVPALRSIEKWWDPGALEALAEIRQAIESADFSDAAQDLAKVAFCRLLIECSRASFRHQSMSFQHDISQKPINIQISKIAAFARFDSAVEHVLAATAVIQPRLEPRILLGDARHLGDALISGEGRPQYRVVITSPPYPNRMSYVRELRPYMYWLGYLDSSETAGELDWQAIGGTWGRATSNLKHWEGGETLPLSRSALRDAIERIEDRHMLLGRYVRKYVVDMATHLTSLKPHLAPGARVTYVVGNSRFFDVMLDTEQIFADLFHAIGLGEIEIRTLRKRTSKRELFEFAVSARA